MGKFKLLCFMILFVLTLCLKSNTAKEVAEEQNKKNREVRHVKHHHDHEHGHVQHHHDHEHDRDFPSFEYDPGQNEYYDLYEPLPPIPIIPDDPGEDFLVPNIPNNNYQYDFTHEEVLPPIPIIPDDTGMGFLVPDIPNSNYQYEFTDEELLESLEPFPGLQIGGENHEQSYNDDLEPENGESLTDSSGAEQKFKVTIHGKGVLGNTDIEQEDKSTGSIYKKSFESPILGTESIVIPFGSAMLQITRYQGTNNTFQIEVSNSDVIATNDGNVFADITGPETPDDDGISEEDNDLITSAVTIMPFRTDDEYANVTYTQSPEMLPLPSDLDYDNMDKDNDTLPQTDITSNDDHDAATKWPNTISTTFQLDPSLSKALFKLISKLASDTDEDESQDDMQKLDIKTSFQNVQKEASQSHNAIWTEWEPWTLCSFNCESTNERTRSRNCVAVDGILCYGEHTQVDTCLMPDFCESSDREIYEEKKNMNAGWTEWTEWSQCTKTCGFDGTMERRRMCIHPEGNICSGPDTETSDCPDMSCQEMLDKYQWLNWGAWSECLCGETIQTRARGCMVDALGQHCHGDNTHSRPCPESDNLCTMIGTAYMAPTVITTELPGIWAEWSSWSDCSVTCGTGLGTRTRNCISPQQAEYDEQLAYQDILEKKESMMDEEGPPLELERYPRSVGSDYAYDAGESDVAENTIYVCHGFGITSRHCIRDSCKSENIESVVTVPEGQFAKLHCAHDSSVPATSINWILPHGEKLTQDNGDERFIMHGSFLSITHAQDFDHGKYHCVVNEEGGGTGTGDVALVVETCSSGLPCGSTGQCMEVSGTIDNPYQFYMCHCQLGYRGQNCEKALFNEVTIALMTAVFLVLLLLLICSCRFCTRKGEKITFSKKNKKNNTDTTYAAYEPGHPQYTELVDSDDEAQPPAPPRPDVDDDNGLIYDTVNYDPYAEQRLMTPEMQNQYQLATQVSKTSQPSQDIYMNGVPSAVYNHGADPIETNSSSYLRAVLADYDNPMAATHSPKRTNRVSLYHQKSSTDQLKGISQTLFHPSALYTHEEEPDDWDTQWDTDGSSSSNTQQPNTLAMSGSDPTGNHQRRSSNQAISPSELQDQKFKTGSVGNVINKTSTTSPATHIGAHTDSTISLKREVQLRNQNQSIPANARLSAGRLVGQEEEYPVMYGGQIIPKTPPRPFVLPPVEEDSARTNDDTQMHSSGLQVKRISGGGLGQLKIQSPAAPAPKRHSQLSQALLRMGIRQDDLDDSNNNQNNSLANRSSRLVLPTIDADIFSEVNQALGDEDNSDITNFDEATMEEDTSITVSLDESTDESESTLDEEWLINLNSGEE